MPNAAAFHRAYELVVIREGAAWGDETDAVKPLDVEASLGAIDVRDTAPTQQDVLMLKPNYHARRDEDHRLFAQTETRTVVLLYTSRARSGGISGHRGVQASRSSPERNDPQRDHRRDRGPGAELIHGLQGKEEGADRHERDGQQEVRDGQAPVAVGALRTSRVAGEVVEVVSAEIEAEMDAIIRGRVSAGRCG